jgi:hypothetical protein
MRWQDMTDQERAQLEYQAQFRRIVGRTILLIACAALLLAVGRMLSEWQPSRRAIPLITGDILYYRGVTFGTNHVAPGLPRLVHVLPAALGNRIAHHLRLAPGSAPHSTSEPSLVLWLDDTHPFVTNRTATVSIDWMLGDATGAIAGPKVQSSLTPGRPGLIRLEFKAFPRRSRILQLQAFTRVMSGSVRPAGSLSVPNPYRSLATEWEPDPLPLTQTNAGLECTLLALPTAVESDVHWTWDEDTKVTLFSEATQFENDRSTAGLFSFRDSQSSDETWTVANVRMSDATGNQLASSATSAWSQHGFILFSYGPSLWPDQTWRLDVDAKRTAKAIFTPQEQFLFENVPVPPEGQTKLIERLIRRDDIEVRLEKIEHHSTANNRVITVTVLNLAERHYLDLIEVIDDQGRAFRGAGWSMSHGNPVEARYFFHEFPAGAQTIDVRLAVHPGLPFTFQVRPERATTNDWSMTIAVDPKPG